jgi:hypothetical protein
VLMLTDLIEEPKPGDAPPPIPLPRAFDGRKAVVRWQVSHDSGRQWTDARTIADTEDASDNPILIADPFARLPVVAGDRARGLCRPAPTVPRRRNARPHCGARRGRGWDDRGDRG